MQADEIAKIKERLTTGRARLLATVGDLNEAAWDWRPEDGRWSVRLALAHVGSAQWSHLEVARRLLAGHPVNLPDFDLDAWNNAQVAERANWSVRQILGDLDAGQTETLAFLDGLEADELAISGCHPALGEVSVGQVLRIIALHDGMHRRDILQLRQEMGERAGG